MMAGVTVSLAIRIRQLRFNRSSILACCAFMLAYLVLAVRYGNVQPLVIAWIFAALVLSETHPVWAGILLSLAVTFKIWPVLFVPWFFHRARVRSAIFFVVAFLTLWIVPIPIFGTGRYWSLLHEWYTAVARVGTTYSEFYYFPGQSLRGLLLRYFTPVAPPLKTFPDIHVISLSPESAVHIWMIISVIVYLTFVVSMLRSDPCKLWAWDGLAFVLYSLLEPYAVKSGLISLGPAALTAACLFTLGTSKNVVTTLSVQRARQFITWANRLFLAACLLSFAEAIMQYKPWQRFLLSIGLDFWAEILLVGAFVIWIFLTPVPESLSKQKADVVLLQQTAHSR